MVDVFKHENENANYLILTNKRRDKNKICFLIKHFFFVN
jgi:hypothetical protein